MDSSQLEKVDEIRVMIFKTKKYNCHQCSNLRCLLVRQVKVFRVKIIKPEQVKIKTERKIALNSQLNQLTEKF